MENGMAARIRLSSLAVCVAALILAMPVAAQTPATSSGQAPAPAGAANGQRPPPSPMPAKPQKPVPKQADCSKLPGGNAPISKMARLEGGISVRNLDLTYFGKPLFELTNDDFDFLTELWPLCKTYDAETAPKVAEKLKSLVTDAKAARQKSLDWIKKTEAEAKLLKPGQVGIEKIHDMWQQMLNKEFEMLESDMTYIAEVLSKRREELYREPEPRQRTLISPFDPGPPDTRRLGPGTNGG